ncbi:MAG: hypothetical protein HY696_12835 [Deltaproteobacteria bacterium]|nr:hypothetical protein [Deltaproteobacteria bacterium]
MGSPVIQQIDCHSPRSDGQGPRPERRHVEAAERAPEPSDADGYLGSVAATDLHTYNEWASHSTAWADRVLGLDQLDFILSSVKFS